LLRLIDEQTNHQMKRILVILLTILTLATAAEARQPQRGYRGFVEWSSSVRNDKIPGLDMGNGNVIMHNHTSFYTGLMTSHGYQINPMFFVGLGLGAERVNDNYHENWTIPVFLQGRVDLKFGKFTPFGDIRIGANMAEGTGVYFSPTIGYRFNWGRKVGINLGVGMSLAGYKIDIFDFGKTESGYTDLIRVDRESHVRAFFTFRLGIDF
jgi:opacity protein-like surface antigen